MVRIVVEVESGTARFHAVVRARNIERAVGSARAQYPMSRVNVLFPIDPDTFFGDDAEPMTGRIQPEMSGAEACGAGT